MSRAWSFLTIEYADRSYMGNAGYQDVLDSHYIWNTTVANGRHVRSGDLAVLRDRDFILGISWIDDISEWPDQKTRYRCKYCGSTKLKYRPTMEYKYRCGVCGEESNERAEEPLDVTIYQADYQRTWQELDTALPVTAIESAYVANAKQHSIRELHLPQARAIIENFQNLGASWWKSDDGDGKKQLPGGHYPMVSKARFGQQSFRVEMLKRFEESCAISGPLPGAMLDAAHVYRYADLPEHHLDGGLLLRRDLHALFDRGDLLIDPDNDWRIFVRPELAQYPEVWRFNGQELLCKPEARPRRLFLRNHAEAARDRWASK
jgi:hypothetical protein